MISTPYIKDCILDQDKTGLIADAIVAGGSEYGMQSFDQDLLRLFGEGKIDDKTVLEESSNPEDIALKLGTPKEQLHGVADELVAKGVLEEL